MMGELQLLKAVGKALNDVREDRMCKNGEVCVVFSFLFSWASYDRLQYLPLYTCLSVALLVILTRAPHQLTLTAAGAVPPDFACHMFHIGVENSKVVVDMSSLFSFVYLTSQSLIASFPLPDYVFEATHRCIWWLRVVRRVAFNGAKKAGEEY
ncbi:unnamed protein product [Hydatigera taeniaeformis]|uniref:Transmembrane protein n=1 Tax=Hydatigena taeniaeformis TaxID=6205 RepID=A0A0R3X8H1_HYDTA|nr:unnamed protein product [Hydatigera taeniaeformis]